MTKQHEVLAKYGRAIVHMRQQMAVDRFGLIFGAGASVELGFPPWKELVDRIAADPQVDGEDLLTGSRGNTSASQLLYQRYRQKSIESAGPTAHDLNRAEAEIRAGWQTIVHKALYRDVPGDAGELLCKDLYVKEFLPIVKKTPLTINYNFDDSLQRMLLHDRSSDERKEKRGFATVWNANIQMYPRKGVIYHPNGFLPFKLRERASEHLVFLEDSFADQLIHSMVGHYTALAYHLAQATRLLVGLSLDDATLKHLLRQNALLHPGHYHYYVSFVRDGEEGSKEIRECATHANFEVYNLVTLFLNANEIQALGQLLSLQEEEFRCRAEEAGVKTEWIFLVTGPVAVGKTTSVSQFRSFTTIDEWLEERPSGMEKDPSLILPEDRERIDAWVAEQVALKNIRLLNSKNGIYIADRAPLDLFAFESDRSYWAAKAKNVLAAIAPLHANRKLATCHVILLTGDTDILEVRAKANHRVTDKYKLEQQQEILRKVYQRGDGTISVVDTRNKSVSEVTKEIARIVHMLDFVETPLHDWLQGYANETEVV